MNQEERESCSLSRHQLLVKLAYHFSEIIAEELVRPTEPAALGERNVLEAVGSDLEVRGDVVADVFEPAELLLGEQLAQALLLSKPLLEPLLDEVWERRQLVVLMERKADKRN